MIVRTVTPAHYLTPGSTEDALQETGSRINASGDLEQDVQVEKAEAGSVGASQRRAYNKAGMSDVRVLIIE